ncbi:MAG: hypothetical protein Q9225_000715 [Loekoesia sp. 1 TL-2023]
MPTPTDVDSDGEDSESMDSLSDEHITDLQATNPTTTINTPPSYLPSLPDSAVHLPSPFDPTEIMSTNATHLSFPFKGLDLPSKTLSLPDNNNHNDYFSHDLFSPHRNPQGHQQRNPSFAVDQTTLPPNFDDHNMDTTTSWDLVDQQVQPSSVTTEGTKSRDDRSTSIMDLGQSGDGASTLILEDIQPQMVTKIINMLFEAKVAVKMKIVSKG